MHSVELHNLYSATNVIMEVKRSKIKKVGHATRMEDIGNVHKILTGKPER
jgi:hypothetical protein